MTQSPFAQLAEVEAEKTRLREALRALVEDAKPLIDAESIAFRLVLRAISRSFSLRGKDTGGWGSLANESLRRLRDGKLRTEEDLLREIANGHMIAGRRPDR